jgi:hypothetical protein
MRRTKKTEGERRWGSDELVDRWVSVRMGCGVEQERGQWRRRRDGGGLLKVERKTKGRKRIAWRLSATMYGG